MEFDADLPITSKKEDRYNRADFAARTAKSLLGLGLDKSFVVGLYGKWGYGKTSVLNLIKHEIGNRATIIDLEPWTYCKGADLAASLLYELKEKLNPNSLFLKICNWYERRKGTLCEAAEDVGNAAGALCQSAGETIKGVGKIAKTMTSMRTYRALKNKIEREIRRSDKPVIVFVDDVDRLEGREMLETFKLIRSVANIRGVHYMLAFDEDLVINSIKEVLPQGQGTFAKDYLEKIIQMPLALPIIKRDELVYNLFNGIIHILSDCNVSITPEERREIRAFCQEAEDFVTAPRIVARCLNALRFVVPPLQDETNISDLIRIELVRVLRADLYQAIRSNYGLFINDYSPYATSDVIEKRKAKFEELISEPDDRWLIGEIFPSVKKCCFGTTVQNNEQEARITRRIFSVDYVDRYFMYGVGKDDIPDQLIMQALCSENVDSEKLTKLLHKNPTPALRKISDHASVASNPDELCIELAQTAASLPYNDTGSRLWDDPLLQALYTVDEIMLAHSYSSSRAFQIYLRILSYCKDLRLIYQLAYVVESRMTGKESKKRILSQEDYEKLQEVIVQIIQELADRDLIPAAGSLMSIKNLYLYWFKFGKSTEQPNSYMKRIVKTPTEAVDFIAQFLGRSTSLSSGETTYQDFFGIGGDVFNAWFHDGFDAKYLYDILVQDENYKKYKGIPMAEYRRFEDLDEKDAWIRYPCNEQTPEFRDIVAQQFICSYESHLERNQPSAD